MNFIQYVKQVWKAGTSGGTPLSPDRLNHMEDGIKNNNSMISELNSNNITNNICTNLLNPTLKTSSQNGITCTNNGDGTYTLNGTASARTVFVLENTADIIKENANKTLRFVSRGDALGTYFVQVYFNNATPAKDIGSGITFKVPTNVSETNVAVAINSGAVLHNIVIKPMITTNLNATYNDFVSYTGNTGRLNADVALLKKNMMTYKDISNFINSYQGRVDITYKKATYRQDGLVQLHVRCKLLQDLPNTLQSLLSIDNSDYYVSYTACTICIGQTPFLGFLNYNATNNRVTIDMADNKEHKKGESIIINAAYFVKI